MKTRTTFRRRGGFTLLELLVVVAILAIIGGAMIASYDGLEGQAATGTATNSLAAIDQAVRTFNVTEGTMPNNVETMLAATPNSHSHEPSVGDNVATAIESASIEPAGFLGAKIAGKFAPVELTNGQLGALLSAGIDTVRYLDTNGNNETVDDLVIKAADGTNATNVGPLSEIDIPQHAFEAPRPGDARNRGRGYAFVLPDPGSDVNGDSGVTLMVWDPGPNGYNNVKVGGRVDSVLVGLGIGNASSIVGTDSFTNLAHAPYYGKVQRNEYNHYVMLVDVSRSPARLVGVVDTRGDFLDEEFAEATGQKR